MFLFFSICFFLRHFLASFTSKVFHLFFAWKEKSLPIQLKCSENHIRNAQIQKPYKIKKTKYWMTKDSTKNFNRIKQSTCIWRPLKYNKCDVGKNYIVSHESNTPILTPIMTIMATSVFTYGQ